MKKKASKAAQTQSAQKKNGPMAYGIEDLVLERSERSTSIQLNHCFAHQTSRLAFRVVANSNPSLFSRITIEQDATLVLEYDLASHGTANLTVRATDDKNVCADQTFKVTRERDRLEPVRVSGAPADLRCARGATMISLGLEDLDYAPHPDTDATPCDLQFEVTFVPDALTFGTVVLADGSTSVQRGKYSLEQIRGMQFQPEADAMNGPEFFSFRVFHDDNPDALFEMVQLDVVAAEALAPTISAAETIEPMQSADAPSDAELAGNTVRETDSEASVAADERDTEQPTDTACEEVAVEATEASKPANKSAEDLCDREDLANVLHSGTAVDDRDVAPAAATESPAVTETTSDAEREPASDATSEAETRDAEEPAAVPAEAQADEVKTVSETAAVEALTPEEHEPSEADDAAEAQVTTEETVTAELEMTSEIDTMIEDESNAESDNFIESSQDTEAAADAESADEDVEVIELAAPDAASVSEPAEAEAEAVADETLTASEPASEDQAVIADAHETSVTHATENAPTESATAPLATCISEAVADATQIEPDTEADDALRFASVPVCDAAEDMPYSYAITTAGAKSRTLTAPNLPAWLTLAGGVDGDAFLSGIPIAGESGSYEIVLELRAEGEVSEQRFSIEVAASAVAATSGGMELLDELGL